MRQKRRRIKEIRVGGVIIAALVIIIVFVFSIGGQYKLFGDKTKYRILFNSTAGLYEGDPVLLTGVEIGNVTKLKFPEAIEQKKILVEIAVQKEVSKRIRKDTRARIGAASLVYGKVVELTMGSPEEPVIPERGFIEADEAMNYGAIVDSTSLMVDDIRRVLSKIDRGQGIVGTLLNEPLKIRQTLNDLSVSSHRLARMMERVDKGKAPLGVLFSDSVEFRQTLEDFKKAASDFSGVVKNLRGKNSALGKLINDPDYGKEFTDDLRSAVHSIANITAKIDTGSGALGSLINDKELYYGLQDVVLGVQKSSVTKWLIQNRRKAGEKERIKEENRKQN